MCSMSGRAEKTDLLVQISLYNRTVRSEAVNKELPFKKSGEESDQSDLSSTLTFFTLILLRLLPLRVESSGGRAAPLLQTDTAPEQTKVFSLLTPHHTALT